MLTLEQINKYLRVDTKQGTAIWKHHNQRPDLIDREAGSINQGYRRITICGFTHYRYQIIWFVHYGEWSTTTIDHTDTNMLNDSITNLREASKAQNLANAGLRLDNTSGYKGVSWSVGKWRADIQIDGVGLYLGRYNTPEEAHQAYLETAHEVWGEEFVRACA